MKKIYTLIAIAITSLGFAQYTGEGTFVKVTSINDLTDGYYVITNETSEFLMTSTHTTFYGSAAVTLTNGEVVDPIQANVWKIETTENGKTIYSETLEAYVGWTSGNSATSVAQVANNSEWTFVYQDEKFTVNNFATPARQLSYNAQSPRFAAYGNNGQHELQFYKLEESTTPEPVEPTATFASESLSGFTYIEAQGPSTSQSVVVNITDLTSENTLSVVSLNTNFEVVNAPSLVNGANTIEIRLASGLEAGEYTGEVQVTLGETILDTITLTGEVTDAPLSNVSNDIEGLRIYPNPANDVVTISTNSSAVKSVQMFDISGKQVLNVETSSTINVSSLSKGIYVVKIVEEGKTSTSKLVIK